MIKNEENEKNGKKSRKGKTTTAITDLMYSFDRRFLESTPLLAQPVTGSRDPSEVDLKEFIVPKKEEIKYMNFMERTKG